MKIINLLPKDEQRELKLELMTGQVIRFWIAVIVILLIVFVLTIANGFWLDQRISANNNEIDSKKQELSSASTKQVEQEVRELNDRIKLVDALRNDHYYWSKAMKELTYMLDSNTKLTLVNMDRETGMVSVQGTAENREGVLAFWSSVMKSGLFEQIDFPLPNLETDTNPDFSFTFYVKREEIKKP